MDDILFLSELMSIFDCFFLRNNETKIRSFSKVNLCTRRFEERISYYQKQSR
jgi:hypothetical protein